MRNNFRGIKKVIMIMVLEGNGTPENPYREVKYFYDLEEHAGTHGGFIGSIDPQDRPDLMASQDK